MTIQSESIKAGPFDGNDSTTVFPFTFKTFAAADLRVVFTSTADVESDLVLDTDYTVSLNADQEASPGGSITYPIAGSPLATGEKLTILNALEFTQGTDLQNGGAWYPEVVENALDRLTLLAQRAYAEAIQGLRVPASDEVTSLTLPTKDSRASKHLAFDAAGEPVASEGAPSVPVSTFMATVLDDADASAALTTLGFSAFIQTLIDDADASAALTTLGFSAFAKTLIDDADAAAARTTLGLGSAALTSGILTVGASVAANALTVTLDAGNLDFRSATLTSGTVNTRNIPSTIDFTVSSGSTLGTVNGVAARLAVLAIDNAGTVEVAIANLAGGVNLDETTLISTTAEGGAGGADSANVIYSTTARANVPFRVVGFIDITEATAGTWATDPTLVQGAGGNAITAMQSLGYGQTWQDVTGSRSVGVTYYNDTGKPIAVHIRASTAASASAVSIAINGLALVAQVQPATTTAMAGDWVIPVGASYIVTFTGGGTLTAWAELR